jgi:signal recognition particle receptor subunit beta
VVVAGGFGVGKTTAVAAISEIKPLRTEAAMTTLASDLDNGSDVPAKTTTTVALDFGCITIAPDLKLYLFGTPGQDRFGFMWNDISHGAIGALVIVDTRRINACYPAVDYFEQIGLPFVVAVNMFDGVFAFELDEVRWALAVAPEVPLVTFDARHKLSVRDALLAVVRHTHSRVSADRALAGRVPPA